MDPATAQSCDSVTWFSGAKHIKTKDMIIDFRTDASAYETSIIKDQAADCVESVLNRVTVIDSELTMMTLFYCSSNHVFYPCVTAALLLVLMHFVLTSFESVLLSCLVFKSGLLSVLSAQQIYPWVLKKKPCTILLVSTK